MLSHHDSFRTYLFTFIALLVLLGLTVGVAYVPLGVWNAGLAMTVATVKMVLILLFFMHLYHSDKLMWIFAFSGIAWFMMLLVTVLIDVFTRGQMIPSGF
jgi:cytochrome c oxidase subunit 4